MADCGSPRLKTPAAFGLRPLESNASMRMYPDPPEDPPKAPTPPETSRVTPPAMVLATSRIAPPAPPPPRIAPEIAPDPPVAIMLAALNVMLPELAIRIAPPPPPPPPPLVPPQTPLPPP